MAGTGIHHEKWLGEDNSINIQGRIMVLGFCPSPHDHLSINQVSFQSLFMLMPTVVLKFVAGQGTGRTGQHCIL